jgi:hypothetical protein
MMLGSAGRSAVDTPICPLPMLLLAVCSARVFAQKKGQIVAAVDEGRCSATAAPCAGHEVAKECHRKGGFFFFFFFWLFSIPTPLPVVLESHGESLQVAMRSSQLVVTRRHG